MFEGYLINPSLYIIPRRETGVASAKIYIPTLKDGEYTVMMKER